MHASTHHMSLYMYALVLKQIALDPLFGDNNFTVSQTSKVLSHHINVVFTEYIQLESKLASASFKRTLRFLIPLANISTFSEHLQ